MNDFLKRFDFDFDFDRDRARFGEALRDAGISAINVDEMWRGWLFRGAVEKRLREASRELS